MPVQGYLLGRLLVEFTGLRHLRDWIGHCLTMAAILCLIYGVAKRLAPDSQLERFMRRLEIPSVAAFQTMLILLLLSRSTHHDTTADFFQTPCDACLDAYWFIYCGNTAYLLCMLIRLLLIIAHDPRSAAAARMYIVASVIGLFAGEDRVAALLTGFDKQGHLAWILTSTAASLVGAAAFRSWRTRNSMWTRPDVPVLLPE